MLFIATSDLAYDPIARCWYTPKSAYQTTKYTKDNSISQALPQTYAMLKVLYEAGNNSEMFPHISTVSDPLAESENLVWIEPSPSPEPEVEPSYLTNAPGKRV